MKAMLVLAIVLLVTACYWQPPDPAVEGIGYDPVYAQIPALGAYSVQDIGLWLWYEFSYLSDGQSEYWQTPEQTYALRAGDCEDFALLMMYMIRQELGGWPEMVLGWMGGVHHAWVRYNGREYEPRYGSDVTGDSLHFAEEYLYYGEAMWRAANLHKSLSEL